MARKLPPFAAIRAFEAAARHCNLQQAAAELLVSPSAVSHQLRSLEAFVGTKMFLRGTNGLELTKEGDSYLQALRKGLDLLELATINVAGQRESNQVTVSTYVSIALEWVLPLLPAFTEANPDVNVNLVTLDEELTFSGSDIDLAIRVYAEPPPGCQSDFLFDETIVPVCSPDYLRRTGPIEQPRDFLRHRLICYAEVPTDWPLWLTSNGVDCPPLDYSVTLDTRTGAIRGACEGLGVAIAKRPYADFMIESGNLVAPIPAPVHVGKSYYLVMPERSQEIPGVRRFRKWLLAASSAREAAGPAPPPVA